MSRLKITTEQILATAADQSLNEETKERKINSLVRQFTVDAINRYYNIEILPAQGQTHEQLANEFKQMFEITPL